MRRPVTITFDGVTCQTDASISVAAAVLNARLAGLLRPAREGEPSGALCGMGSCHECRVEIDGVPHRRGCLVFCREGMQVRTPGGSP